MNPGTSSVDVTTSGNMRPPRALTSGRQRLRIFDMASGILLGYTADLSVGGMRVVSDRPIPTGQAFRLWLEIHCTLGERTRALLDAESIWTHSTVRRDSYESGLRITDATPEAKKGIKALLNDIAGSD